ncbi:DUF3515 domain-containing protein [Amycolatopsis suaedae]|uniref:DUF3515 domain-containing protein n=1 Tax=Amycolatopsis suaedae TaxID=2510978 RepID=A0A4Q7JBL1_9PSEU|nr:DUF3515 domain-containing protein [Amycolatopsis suaedae]RZQ64679.1 DUF3515 domain-containing protein [Amycolatopsis suaedae]
MPEQDTETGGPPRVLIVTATVIAVLFAAGVAVFGIVTNKPEPDQPAAGGPLPLVSVPAPQAGTPACARLIERMPGELTSNGRPLARRTLADPAPPAAAAWGDPAPVVLRCGLDRPPELTPTAPLRLVNGVQWLQVQSAGTATWYAVDREVYAALTVPDTAGTGPLQTVSDVVAAALPPQPLRF